MHNSVSTIDRPEFINLQPSEISPLMSSCQIKVFYLGENRNGSSISKETALKMASTLRGAPIVGYYRKDKGDFGDHGEKITIENGEITFECMTVPYGFIPTTADVWFQDFEDEDEFGNKVTRTYLVTNGYLWTGQFEEAQMALEEGRPHSMELDDKTLDGHWAENYKSGIEFFIINDAVISKLCILGNDVEPCFEGSSITKPVQNAKFTKIVDDDFKATFALMRQMMENLQYALEGGQPMLKVNEVESTNETNYNLKFEDGGDADSPDEVAAEAADAAAEAESEAADAAEEAATAADSIASVEDTVDPETLVEGDVGQVNAETAAEAAEVQAELAQAQADIALEASQMEGATSAAEQSAEDAQDSADNAKESAEAALADAQEAAAKASDIQSSDAAGAKKRDFELELNELQNKYDSLLAEVETLRAFKLTAEKETLDRNKAELVNKYSSILSAEEIASINVSEFTLEGLENKFNALYIANHISFDKKDSEETKIATVTFNVNEATTSLSTMPSWLAEVKKNRDNR